MSFLTFAIHFPRRLINLLEGKFEELIVNVLFLLCSNSRVHRCSNSRVLFPLGFVWRIHVTTGNSRFVTEVNVDSIELVINGFRIKLGSIVSSSLLSILFRWFNFTCTSESQLSERTQSPQKTEKCNVFQSRSRKSMYS